MNLTKNQIYIISSVIIIAVIYFMFFRKKTTSTQANKMATPPASGESGYFGEDWGWGQGAQSISEQEALVDLSGPASNSVAGLPGILGNPAVANPAESGYNEIAGNWGPYPGESNFEGVAPWEVPMS